MSTGVFEERATEFRRGAAVEAVVVAAGDVVVVVVAEELDDDGEEGEADENDADSGSTQLIVPLRTPSKRPFTSRPNVILPIPTSFNS
jgi:hypothetical protein